MALPVTRMLLRLGARLRGHPPKRARPLAAKALANAVNAAHGPFAANLLAALVSVPRERFVREADLASAYADHPLPLDDVGLATISAPHAYLLSFRLAELDPGDALLELGSGSGYGAALASAIVGPTGRVRTIEIDPTLAGRTKALLSACSNVEMIHGDAADADLTDFPKTIVTYAVRTVPERWLRTLPVGGLIVVPLGKPNTNQRLVKLVRTTSGVTSSDHGGVRYVPDRSPLGA